MSKLEEALEKANKLRNSTIIDDKSQKIDIFRKVEPGKIDNDYIVTVTQPDSPITEEYRRLKAILIRETKADFLNTIMITSSVNGEGKTLTAVNLAVTLAQEIDHTILLIDADLRKPMIHEYLGIKYEYGLSDYLTQDIDISEVLIKTGIGNMVFLPAGRIVKNPVELLSSEKMKALIKELKQRYMDRYIIIDTPPILSCAEGIAIGSYIDGIVFVVREGQAQRKTIEDALNMIQELNIIGVVFNNVSAANLDGHYSGYYSSYKKKEKK
ncbi:MAG TPA: polysaccharide biosynthesis tyrosine autokinase [Nitrospirae bacterium]|nr:polysaccharide biosynthesis tyrosine autokinase [Nitrospirota bacterium]